MSKVQGQFTIKDPTGTTTIELDGQLVSLSVTNGMVEVPDGTPVRRYRPTGDRVVVLVVEVRDEGWRVKTAAVEPVESVDGVAVDRWD